MCIGSEVLHSSIELHLFSMHREREVLREREGDYVINTCTHIKQSHEVNHLVSYTHEHAS